MPYTAAQSMWRGVFVDADLLRSETAIHYSRLQAGDFDVGLASWLAVYDDPQTFTLLAQTGPPVVITVDDDGLRVVEVESVP